MKKILIIYNYILHYRVPFFNELSKYYDVTIIHSGKSIKEDSDEYSEIIVNSRKLGPFNIQSNVMSEASKLEYDIIITLFDLRWISSIFLFLKMRFLGDKRLNILWGAWLTNSNLANYFRLKLMNISEASVFYTQKSRNDFLKIGMKTKSYVANNTFDIPKNIRQNCSEFEVKDYILTVGSLDKRKGIDKLISSFYRSIPLIKPGVKLVIVGGGHEEPSLKLYVEKLGITERVVFTGVINSPNELLDYYKRAILCCSYNQAGLFVLQSLGYGVPFITRKDAISGGEKYNVVNLENGFLVNNLNDLTDKIALLSNDLPLSRTMGANAYEYYSNFCTISNMAQGFRDAINDKNEVNIDYRQDSYDY